MRGGAWWLGLAIGAAVSGPIPAAEAVRVPVPKSQPDVILYVGSYPGWPWVTGGKGGRLYCVFREGSRHMFSAEGRVMFCASPDKGRTWSRPVVIADHPGVDDRNAAVTELADGDLLVVFNTYTRDGKSLAMSVRSRDQGRTWTRPTPIDRPNTRTRAAPIQLADGTVLLPYYIAPGNGALAAWSRDGGLHWTTVRVPDAPGFVGDEWDVLEVEPGRIVGILRNAHAQRQGFFWKTESRDGGRTWSAPRRTNVQSRRAPAPAQLCRHGRTPTLIYPDRRMVSVAAVKSADPEFIRWDVNHRVRCYQYRADGRPIRDGGYAVSVQTGPRERLIVDYEIRREGNRIAGYFVSFPADW